MKQALRSFKHSKKNFCTGPSKWYIDVYPTCPMGCVYCYSLCHRKFNKNGLREIIPQLKKELKEKKRKYVYLSPFTDPYHPIEKEMKLTRQILKILKENKWPYYIVTKSTLLTRDIDILKGSNCIVHLTMTTSNEKKAKMIEHNCPLPKERLEAIKELRKNGIPVVGRLQPIIPSLTDDKKELKHLIEELKKAGVKHITAGTMKLYPLRYEKIKSLIPPIEDIYFKKSIESDKRKTKFYFASKKIRYEIMKYISDLCKKNEMTFACCHEGFYGLNTETCSYLKHCYDDKKRN